MSSLGEGAAVTTPASSQNGVVPSAKASRRLSSRARLGLGSLCACVASLLAGLAAASPWWYLTQTAAGGSTTVAFYPGADLRVTSVGGGGSESYASAGVPSVGILYEGILVGSVLLALAALAVLVLLVARARGHGSLAGPARRFRGIVLAALLLGLLLAAIAPVAQPQLYRGANPDGSCSGSSPVAACQGFWGSSTHEGLSSVWGAAPGWWLDLFAAGAFGLTLWLGSGARPATGSEPTSPPRRQDSLKETASPASGSGADEGPDG